MLILSLILTLSTGALQQNQAPQHFERGKALFWTHCSDSIERTFEGKQQAVKELQEAVKLDPHLAEAHLYLARIYQCLAADYTRPDHRNEYEDLMKKAVHHAREAVRLASKNAEAHYELASLLDYDRSKYEKISELEKALELNPNYADAMWLLGIILAEDEQAQEESIGLMKAAIAKINNPDLTITKRGRLAGLLEAKGRYREALQWYETLLPSKAVEEIIRDLKKKIQQQKPEDGGRTGEKTKVPGLMF